MEACALAATERRTARFDPREAEILVVFSLPERSASTMIRFRKQSVRARIEFLRSTGLRATAMFPIGNYAYQIDFSDGHKTGIFSLELLRDIGESRAGES